MASLLTAPRIHDVPTNVTVFQAGNRQRSVEKKTEARREVRLSLWVLSCLICLTLPIGLLLAALGHQEWD